MAEEAITCIGVLYRIEAEAKGLTADARHAHRQRFAVPVVRELKAWLLETRAGTLGHSKVIDYTLRRWDALARYADDGRRYPIDKKTAENTIRPITLGRKNWILAGSEDAGQRAATIMNILATAKANDIASHA